jgi:ATPase subunit of ABC transporter with duplicated ATPase domains
MDLPSIICLQEALADCPCGLVLVSHDRRLLEKLTGKEWCIREESSARESFVLHIVQ